jgi:hypothetical protein
MNCRALAKRPRSPASTMMVAAVTRRMPRSACSPSTTGASDQAGSRSAMATSIRARRSRACRSASTISCRTIC